MKVAQFLESHPSIERVHYPGLLSHPQRALAHRQMVDGDRNFAPGSMIYFMLKGTPEEARLRGQQVMDHLATNALAVTLAVSLGQLRTLIEHPASMTHAAIPVADQLKAGIDPGGIRLSIGLEAAQDINNDLGDALEAVMPVQAKHRVVQAGARLAWKPRPDTREGSAASALRREGRNKVVAHPDRGR